MKRNVDLTEDRAFSNQNENNENFNTLLTYNMNKPWGFKLIEISSDFDFGINSESLIPLGNKEEREKWKKRHSAPLNTHCPICGKREFLPWSLRLCRCRIASSTQVKKFPWEF